MTYMKSLLVTTIEEIINESEDNNSLYSTQALHHIQIVKECHQDH